MIKLIACDIDGTLLQHGETEISPRFFAAAEALLDRGIAVCAASGRQYRSLRRLFAPLADRMHFLFENGAVVFGPGEPPRLLSRSVMPRDTAVALCREIAELEDCEFLISGTNTSYLCPKAEDYVNLIEFFVGNNTTVLPDPQDIPEEIVKVSAFHRHDARLVEPILRPRWESEFQVAIAGLNWLDFTVADKGTGIRALCHALDIATEDAMAFGDNYNDIPMLSTVGHPYLMDTAAAPLREKFPQQCRRPEDILES